MKKTSILVVDDNINLARSLCLILERWSDEKKQRIVILAMMDDIITL